MMKPAKTPLVIHVQWDGQHAVWTAVSSDLPGLFAQADTYEEMLELLPHLVTDLLSMGPWPEPELGPIPLEILARSQSLAYPHE